MMKMQRNDDAVFRKQAANLIAQLGAVTHESASDPMQHLHICCRIDFCGTKRISGRLAASQIPAASCMSFFCPRTYGFTNRGAMSLTSWPKVPITRAQ